MTTTTPERPLLFVSLAIIIILSSASAILSFAALRTAHSEPATNTVSLDGPSELGQVFPRNPTPALPTITTLPETPSANEQTSSTPVVVPTTSPVPASTVPQSSAGEGPLVTGRDASSPNNSWTKPALLETRADPAYELPITRMTSAEGTRFNRNTYSRRQAENADGSAFMTYHGDAEYRVYDTATGEQLATTNVHPDGEPQWHPTNPDVIRHVTGPNAFVGSLTLLETTVSTGATSVVADLTTRVQAVFPTALYMIDRAEGSPSADGSRYAWIIYNDNEDPVGIISYDLATDTILGSVPVDPSVDFRLDWVSASPSGQFVMAGFWEGTVAWNADMTNERLIFEGTEHSDIAIGPTGNDTYIYVDFTASANGGWIVAVDLVTGETRRYVDLYDNANTSIHFSGKAYDMPGWVVASTYNCKEPGAWSCEKVFALNLADGTIVNLAHTYNCGSEYWTETHAVANRDLSRVYFNSDAGSCSTDAEVYRIDVPLPLAAPGD